MTCWISALRFLIPITMWWTCFFHFYINFILTLCWFFHIYIISYGLHLTCYIVILNKLRLKRNVTGNFLFKIIQNGFVNNAYWTMLNENMKFLLKFELSKFVVWRYFASVFACLYCVCFCVCFGWWLIAFKRFT